MTPQETVDQILIFMGIGMTPLGAFAMVALLSMTAVVTMLAGMIYRMQSTRIRALEVRVEKDKAECDEQLSMMSEHIEELKGEHRRDERLKHAYAREMGKYRRALLKNGMMIEGEDNEAWRTITGSIPG